MKAFLLAAGLGTRLRPLTDTIPKCLVRVGGKPLLEHWLEKCDRYGIDEVLINGHYLADQVEAFLEKNLKKFSVRVRYVYEDNLQGTGGTVRDNIDFVKNDQSFFIFHADSYNDINLLDFLLFHQERNSPLTLAMHTTKNPSQAGIIEAITERGLIMEFREKPSDPRSDLASAALFLATHSIRDTFPLKGPFDFSKECVPKFAGRMYGYRIQGFHVDVGTLAKLAYANELAKSISPL